MRQRYAFVYALFLYISGCYTQDTTTPLPDWNGDPNLCTVYPPATSSPIPAPPMPRFSNQAEFALERVEIKHVMNVTLPSELTMYEYLYDYDANKLIMVKNKNGFIDVEYYYYEILKKSTYYRGEFCAVTDIPQNSDMDGASAIRFPNGTWHIRPMNEFLLFSSDEPSRRVTPVYLGKDTIRGIPVDKWQTCYINKTEYRTVKRVWAFAQQGVKMPNGPVGDLAYPVQANISASLVLPNNTEVFEFDEVFNVLSYRQGISESTSQLSPPKGVFCSSGEGQQLNSLSELGINWPNRFSVRVEASSSRSPQWQRFHLRYDQGRENGSRRIRYDYMPPGAEDYESVIRDYTDNLTYVIDRRLGTCQITRGVDIPEVSAIRDPIQFFIKHESEFIFKPRDKVWERNGYRACRGNGIQCSIVTTSFDNFPVIVDPDTGAPSGEKWASTNVEYGWSRRSPFAPIRPNSTQLFDYPVSLFLRMYRYENPADPSPTAIRSEDIEYEFYEMSYERHPYDFDTSICSRSLGYEYLHMVFNLRLNRDNVIDGNHLSRRSLERDVTFSLANIMQIRYSRIGDLEIDHERTSNEVTVFFTVLNPTPAPGTASGVATDQPSAQQAAATLKQAINENRFVFSMRLEDDSQVEFRAVQNSLKESKQYISTHTAGKQVVTEKYTDGSQATAVLVGLLVGIIIGAIIAAVVRVVRKQPMPAVPTSIRNPIPGVNFKSNNAASATSKA